MSSIIPIYYVSIFISSVYMKFVLTNINRLIVDFPG